MEVSERTVKEKQVTITKDEIAELICDSSAEELADVVKCFESIERNAVVRAKFFDLMVLFSANVAHRVVDKIFEEEK